MTLRKELKNVELAITIDLIPYKFEEKNARLGKGKRK